RDLLGVEVEVALAAGRERELAFAVGAAGEQADQGPVVVHVRSAVRVRSLRRVGRRKTYPGHGAGGRWAAARGWRSVDIAFTMGAGTPEGGHGRWIDADGTRRSGAARSGS